MATLTKAEIVNRVCEKNGLRRDDASKFAEATFEIIKASLHRGERVTLINFGNFTPVRKNLRKGLNPKTGTEIVIPEHTFVRFKPSGAMKKTVNRSSITT